MASILRKPLAEQYRPRAVTFDLGNAVDDLERAHRELAAKAGGDANGCIGYFPALAGFEGITMDLPASKVFAASVPDIAVGGITAAFNFLRYSNRKQGDGTAYHIDTDAATALTGDIRSIDRRLVRRVLLNLSPDASRTVAYLDIDPHAVELEVHGSYIGLRDTEVQRGLETEVVIPPRHGAIVHGFDFYSNRVLHSGRDDDAGHFVAGYGYEKDI